MVWSSNYLQKKFIKSKTMVPLDPTKRGGGYSLTMALPEGSYDFTIIDDNETPITLFRDRQCEVYDNIAFYRMEVGEGPMFSTPEEKRRGGSDIASDSSLLDLKERLLEIGEKYCGICRVSGKEEQCVFEVLEHVEKMFQRSPSPRRGASYHKPEMVLDDVSYSEAYDESSITAGDGHDLVRRINLLNGRFLGGGEGSAMDIIIKTERRLKTLEGYGKFSPILISRSSFIVHPRHSINLSLSLQQFHQKPLQHLCVLHTGCRNILNLHHLGLVGHWETWGK
eukprot:TRINITY_DN1524_c1_g2_i4.p1 TRINITY_DN1524_c1_g2~~TRINITY_DN1524_c1_g2_i4.p1  ORF type:complete len:281 (+),score=52.11 TRINITY_DN1524_c1_g2_i4:365-1207(+)